MSRIDVRPARVAIAERFDEHVLVRVVQAARPVEPEAAGLGARGLGEGAADLGPAIANSGLICHLAVMKIICWTPGQRGGSAAAAASGQGGRSGSVARRNSPTATGSRPAQVQTSPNRWESVANPTKSAAPTPALASPRYRPQEVTGSSWRSQTTVWTGRLGRATIFPHESPPGAPAPVGPRPSRSARRRRRGRHAAGLTGRTPRCRALSHRSPRSCQTVSRISS